MIPSSYFLDINRLIPIASGSNCFQDIDINLYPDINQKIIQKRITGIDSRNKITVNNYNVFNNININHSSYHSLDQEKIDDLTKSIRKQLSDQFFGPMTGESENRRKKQNFSKRGKYG